MDARIWYMPRLSPGERGIRGSIEFRGSSTRLCPSDALFVRTLQDVRAGDHPA
jgi:hypothetical protein